MDFQFDKISREKLIQAGVILGTVGVFFLIQKMTTPTTKPRPSNHHSPHAHPLGAMTAAAPTASPLMRHAASQPQVAKEAATANHANPANPAAAGAGHPRSASRQRKMSASGSARRRDGSHRRHSPTKKVAEPTTTEPAHGTAAAAAVPPAVTREEQSPEPVAPVAQTEAVPPAATAAPAPLAPTTKGSLTVTALAQHRNERGNLGPIHERISAPNQEDLEFYPPYDPNQKDELRRSVSNAATQGTEVVPSLPIEHTRRPTVESLPSVLPTQSAGTEDSPNPSRKRLTARPASARKHIRPSAGAQTEPEWFGVQKGTQTELPVEFLEMRQAVDLLSPIAVNPAEAHEHSLLGDLHFTPESQKATEFRTPPPRRAPAEPLPRFLAKEAGRQLVSLLDTLRKDDTDVFAWMAVYAYLKRLPLSAMSSLAALPAVKERLSAMQEGVSAESAYDVIALRVEVLSLLTTGKTSVEEKHFQLKEKIAATASTAPTSKWQLSLCDGTELPLSLARQYWQYGSAEAVATTTTTSATTTTTTTTSRKAKDLFAHLRVEDTTSDEDDKELARGATDVDTVAALIYQFNSIAFKRMETLAARVPTAETEEKSGKKPSAEEPVALLNKSTTPENTSTLGRLYSATEAKRLFHRIVEMQASDNFYTVRHTPELSHFACDFLEVATVAQRLYDLSLMEDMSVDVDRLPATTLKGAATGRVNTTTANQLSPVKMQEQSPSSPSKPGLNYRRSQSAVVPNMNGSTATTPFKRVESSRLNSISYPFNSSPPDLDAPATNVFERLYSPPATKKLDVRSPSHSRTKAPFKLYV